MTLLADTLNRLPPWTQALAWTVLKVGAAYGVGHVFRLIAINRLKKWAHRTGGKWDDLIGAEIVRRIPFWSVLVGCSLSLGHWPLSDDARRTAAGVISALGVVSATFAAAEVSTRLVATYGPRGTPLAPVSGLTQTVVRILVTLIGMLVLVRSIGFDITPMLTALGVGGLAVALALQEPLSNLFAGLFTSLAGQVRIGDYIRLDSGIEGFVVDFNWRSTRLRQQSDSLVMVPNAKLSQAIVTNYTLAGTDLGVGVDFRVPVGVDLELVERLALDVAASVLADVPGGVPTATPAVRYVTVMDNFVQVSVGLRARTFVDAGMLKHVFLKRLYARFVHEGVETAHRLVR